MSSTPDTRLIRGSAIKNGIVAIAFAAVVALGLQPDVLGGVLGIVLAVVLGVFALFFAYQALRALPTLELDESGFELSTGLATVRFPWSEYHKFRVGRLGGPILVSFERKDSGRQFTIFNQFVVGTADLCETLAAWQRRYGEAAPTA